MNTVFGVPVINILWTIVAGRRFQLDDPRVERMMTLLNRFVPLRREESEDLWLFQIVQGSVHPGVSVPSVRPPVLLHPRPGHQKEDHHGAETDVPAVHLGTQELTGHQPAQVRPVSHLSTDHLTGTSSSHSEI